MHHPHLQSHAPQIIDLGMSDEEYLALLAQGRDPVKEQRYQAYEQELIAYGIAPAIAQQVAPLFEKAYPSIAERILVAQVLKQVWQQLMSCRPIPSWQAA